MNASLADRGTALLQSLAIHALLLAGLVYGLDMTAETIQPRFPNVIQAVVVDTQAIVAARQERKAAEQKVLRDAAIERRREQERAEAERRREAEAIAARREVETEQARRMADERRRQAELEQRQKELQAQREQVRAEREKQQRDLEAAQAARQEEEKRRQQALEEQRRQQLLALEDQQRQSSEDLTKLEEWVGLIGALVRQNWRKPPTAASGARCRVLVNQLPGGDVISASVAPGCRVDEVTKRSIVDAVLRSEPLPYKGYERVFRRQLTFEFVVD